MLSDKQQLATPTADPSPGWGDNEWVRACDHPYFARPFTALAHRGGSLLEANLGRENTLAAFRNAVELGCDHLETDVHATRDGALVAFHDDSLDRVSDRSGRIAELTLAQVRRARVGGEPVPTLDELLEDLPQTFVNIDIKAPGAVEPLVRVLRRHGAERRVCVGSFSTRRLWRFRRLAGPGVATAVGPLGVGWSALTRVGARALPPVGLAFQMPSHVEVTGRRVELVTEAFVASAHAAGRAVHVWTVNDPTEMAHLMDLGVDGIVTDAIDVLLDLAGGRGLL